MKNKIQLSLIVILFLIGIKGISAAVNAGPVVDFSYSGSCVASAISFTVDNSVTNTANVSIWHWDFGDGFTSTYQDTQHTYAGAGTYTVSLTITDISGLTGTISHPVIIKQLPVANFAFSTPDCNNESIQFTDLSSTDNGYIEQWTWDFGDGSPLVNIVPPASPNPVHTFPNSGIFKVTLRVKNTDLCENTVEINVTVSERPTANFYFSGACEDQEVSFLDASSAYSGGSIVVHKWEFRDPVSGINTESNLENPTHIFPNAGTYLVKLTIKNYNDCIDTISKNVIINPHPTVDFAPVSICLNKAAMFSPDLLVTNVSDIATWTWDFGDGHTSNSINASHVFTVSGNFPVTLTVQDKKGCLNSVTHVITVDPLPVPNFAVALSGCAGSVMQFENQSVPAVGYFISKWQWDFGDGNSVTISDPGNPDVSHVYLVPNIYNVTLTITGSNGCTNSEVKQISIKPNPVVNFDFTPACIGTTSHFTDLTNNNGAGAIQNWTWDFDDSGSGIHHSSVLKNPDHSFSVTGNHSVQLIVNTLNGCSDTITRLVNVKSAPAVNFSTTNNCQNNSVIFEPDPAGMNISAVSSWNWDFGTGATSALQNPTYIYTSAGVQNAKLTITDNSGCTNSVTRSIVIIPQPKADFSYLSPACKQSLVVFNNLSEAAPGIIVRSEWDFGDGYTLLTNLVSTVSHTFNSYGTYNVSLTIITSDSCRKTKILPVVILPNPTADFSFQNNCIHSSVQFNNMSVAAIGGLASLRWDFGDPASGGNNTSSTGSPTHIFNSTGNYQVSLVVVNTGGCSDTVVKMIKVNALPDVDFTFTAGCVNNSTKFAGSSFVNTGSLVMQQWSFGDGSGSTRIDPEHVYSMPGSYIVTLSVTDSTGCSNSKTQTVDIVEPPVSSFAVSAQTCSQLPVFFTNQSTPSTGILTSVYWEFGDGSDTLIMLPGDANVAHTYASGGTYLASLTVYNSLGCSSKSQHTVKISSGPSANFTYSNSCESAEVHFNDISLTNSGSAIVTWAWDFGDLTSGPDNTSTLQNPNHSYSAAGAFIVKLKVTNATGCSEIISKNVIIKPKPGGDFTWNDACLGSATSFTLVPASSNSSAVVTCDWDFGDGTPHNLSQINPVHTYALMNDFTVSVIITNQDGCKNSLTNTVKIKPNPIANFSSTSACAGTATRFSDHSTDNGGAPVMQWNWNFGVASSIADSSDLQSPEWVYPEKGIYNVKLTVFSQSGCKAVATGSVQVFGNPTADFSYTSTACDAGTVHFQNTSLGQQATIVDSKWEFDPNSFSTTQNPTYNFYAPDSCYNVRLMVKDLRGCADTVVKAVCVPAEFNFSFEAKATCIKDTTHFIPQLLAPSSDQLVKFRWDFGDLLSGVNNTSTQKVPSHYYAQTGTYTISLEATDINNCTKTIYKNITISALPTAAFTLTKGLCDSTLYFNESSSGNGSELKSWIWNFGDGISSTVSNSLQADISHFYRSPGSYNVGLTVINANGCSNSIMDSNILVSPCLDAAFELIDKKVCQNTMVAFSNNSFSSVTSNIWYWDFGDGSHSTQDIFSSQINHIYKTPGAFMVRMIMSTYVNGRKVSDTAHQLINVNPSPVTDFAVKNVCNQNSAVFTNRTSGSGIKIENYKWSFGEPVSGNSDTSNVKDPVHLYSNPGTYEVILEVQNSLGCSDSVHKFVKIFGLPVADFKSELSCAGNKTVFKDLSIVAGAPIATWQWIFKDNIGTVGGMEGKNPQFVFRKPGDYTAFLKITDTNGCRDSITQFVSTWDVPVSKFDIQENYNNVQGQLLLNNNSADASRYHWTFGNGDYSYAEKPVVVYPDEGHYTIILEAFNEKGCSDTVSMKYNFMVKSLYIPNAFSPLNPIEGVKLLKPVGINLATYKFEVFDRWGNLLWWTDKLDSAGSPTEGWDGRYKDALMPEGAYPWRASGVFKDGTIWQAENVGNNDHLPGSRTGSSTMMR